MSDIAIRVDGLGKQYRLGQRKRSNSLRESLVHAFKAPWRRSGKSRTARANGDTFWALKDVSFDVRAGEVLGVIGRNGAGKSTLLKILSRITEPTTGEVEIRGRVGSLLEVGTGFHPELTGRENVYLNGAILGMKRTEIARKFDEIVAFAEVEKFIDTPVKHYSSGMYMRLAFAVAAHLEPEILVVDEVLAVGDTAFQQKCLGKMDDVARAGRTVLFVSHNMAAIETLCSSAVLLDRGAVAERGQLHSVVAAYLHQNKAESITYEGSPVEEVSVRQVGDTVVLTVQYRVQRPLPVACLGFVISDHLGQPICGMNPVTAGLRDFGKGTTSGQIRITLTQPKLLDGTYRLSIWFGDSKEDWFVERDCVVFQVTKMVTHDQRYPTSGVGCVSPNCAWDLKDARLL